MVTRDQSLFKQESMRSLEAELRKNKKAYGISTLSGLVFKKIEDFFVCQLITPIIKEGKDLVIQLQLDIKPYIYDDIFWDIMDMKDNKHAKESLRANGAFTCPVYTIKMCEIPFTSPDLTVVALLEIFESETELFLAEIDHKIENFNSLVACVN